MQTNIATRLSPLDKSMPEAVELFGAAILLDVDGTILDMATTPQSVTVPASLRRTLGELHAGTEGALALVSGRLIDNLDGLFAPLRLPAIGGHGAERRVAADGTTQPRCSGHLGPLLKDRVAEVAKLDIGIILEDKGSSLALHYRLAPQLEPAIRRNVTAVLDLARFRDVEMLCGKFVIEIKPRGFDKGEAVRELMKLAPFAGRRPVFIGDDTTDESVFAVLPELGGLGYSVGRQIPGANGTFGSPAQVREWLVRLCGRDERDAE